jgi:hypothetical protein
MADIPVYASLEDKRLFFENEEFFIINTKADLDRWFRFYSSDFKKEHPVDFIFRGMSDAKYKLFTSAQRLWISDNMEQWRVGYTYKQFIEDLVSNAKANPLLRRIFDLYGYNDTERDFPLISLLQHYGAPTPVLDWSYNINCAVFFATDGVQRKLNAGNTIDNYISVYSIHKKRLHQKKELLSLFDISGKRYPSIMSMSDLADEDNPNANVLFILSDFETTTRDDYTGPLRVKSSKPLTSLYNQNIIPQEGLLMYNPFKDRPIERLFNVDPNGEGQNLHLEPFKCFNIHKDLSEYLRRLIANRHGIKKSFMYPHLYDNAKAIKEAVLNSVAV